jgi:cyclophilin family peptidyl-prolyl cis-trans isomerase
MSERQTNLRDSAQEVTNENQADIANIQMQQNPKPSDSVYVQDKKAPRDEQKISENIKNLQEAVDVQIQSHLPVFLAPKGRNPNILLPALPGATKILTGVDTGLDKSLNKHKIKLNQDGEAFLEPTPRPIAPVTATNIPGGPSTVSLASNMLNNAAVLAAHPAPSPNPIVFLDINVGTAFVGRLIIELFANVTPHTCQNFLSLCRRGDKEKTTEPISQEDTLPLGGTYQGSGFHRLIPRLLIQGGNIFGGNMGDAVPDENFLLKHETAGLLATANAGAPNTGDGAQFFITLSACAHLDGKHVVFGLVRRGLGILEKLAALPTDTEDRPLQPVTIVNCGEIRPGESLGEISFI